MRIALALLTVGLLANFSSAQTRMQMSGPVIPATLDLDSGRFGPAPAGQEASSLCFDNTVDDDFASDALLYPAGFELYDWGVKSCGGPGFVDSITIGYGSRAVPTQQGGPGGALLIRVYAGGTGFGQFGTLVTTIALTGLPSDPSLAVAPRSLQVALGSDSFYLPDGPIAWSYENLDGLTAPLLVDVTAALGTENAYDVYSPGPASVQGYTGTFVLPPGGTSNDPKENSFYFQIYQNDSPAAQVSIPAGSNPTLFASPRPPVLGTLWTAIVDLTGVRSTGVSLVALTRLRLAPTSSRFGTLVVDLDSLLIPVSIAVVDSHRFALPLDSALVGFQFYAQGAYLDANGMPRFTNGMDLTVGTF